MLAWIIGDARDREALLRGVLDLCKQVADIDKVLDNNYNEIVTNPHF